MPMRPVREDVYDTAPMRPMNIRSGYEGYRRTIDRRREVIRTERPVSRRVNSRKGKKERTSGRTRYENRNSLSALIARQRSAAGKEQYFDYDLLFVIIFLMCFGLVMLYSVSFYEAQADFGNDMYYFSKQALIGVGGFIGMYLVSKLDYHLYGAFAFEIYVISMFLMALVQTPLGVTVNGARRWIGLPGNLSLQPAEITKIAVILFISYELCRLGKRAYSPKGIAQILAFGAVASAGVLFLTDNLSTAIIVAGITCILIFVSHPYVISMFLMALVQTPLGVTVNGARRWIGLPGNLSLQPAEITKIAVILFISYELCRLGKRAYSPKGIAQILAFGAVASAGVLFLTDNLSTAIIVAGITCILIFVSHPKTKPFLVIIGIGIAVAAVGIAILSVTVANSDNFRLQRVISWLNPEATADTGSFQVMQGLYAIGSGGLFGKGLGNSTQKLGVIPEAQNDMILVVICEELGVFGAVVILVLFALLLYRLIFIAKNAPDLFGSLIATGIFAHIALQVILNIAVVTGLLPTTGITLPFISYGGTAIVFLMAEMGIALGISRKIRLE